MELHSPMAAYAKAGTMGTIGRGNETVQPPWQIVPQWNGRDA